MSGRRAMWRCALLVAVGIQASESRAHQDLIIELGSDGTLKGLPAEYQPARLSVPVSPDAGLVVLQLGKKRLEFPDCLYVLFAKASRAHMRVSASWDHDVRLVPHYLAIRLPLGAPNAHGFYDGWSILVDLKKAEVLRVQAVFTTNGGRSEREQEIDVKTFCTGGVGSLVTP